MWIDNRGNKGGCEREASASMSNSMAIGLVEGLLDSDCVFFNTRLSQYGVCRLLKFGPFAFGWAHGAEVADKV